MPSKPKPITCPDCSVHRPGYQLKQKFQPPCPACGSDKPAKRLAPAPLSPINPEIDKTDPLRRPRTHDLLSTQVHPQAKIEDISGIDFAAALTGPTQETLSAGPAQPQGETQEASPATKRRRGRPKNPDPPTGTIKRPRGRQKGYRKPKSPSLYNINNSIDEGSISDLLIPDILVPGQEEESTNRNKPGIKEELTKSEQKFIDLLLSGKHSVDKCMILAGYGQFSKAFRFNTAAKIVNKYELGAGDHRKIMGLMGWGVIRTIQSLIEAATKFGSETVKLNARIALAKCLGIQNEVLEAVQGIQIVINNPSQVQGQEGYAVPAGAQQQAQATIQGVRPLQITK